MNRKSYLRIISAIIKLLVVIMMEAGRVPYKNAMTIGDNVMRAITGSATEKREEE